MAMKIPQKVVHSYLRHNKKFPHVWCAGCANGIILGAIVRSIAELQIPKDDIAMVSGIGCSSRMPVYVDFNTLHTLHGRAIPSAIGIKMYKPHMKVIVVTGDGDATAIGGNHFIHGCRRNIDITVILINNNIYGMTGGQYSPTTPEGARATTMPFGNYDNCFDLCKLAEGAGASFVSRTTAFHVTEMQQLIAQAINHKGFSLVEIASTCPVIFGRLNKKGSPADMLKYLRDNSLPTKQFEVLPEDQKALKIERGIFKQVERPEFCSQYYGLVEKLKAKEGAK